MHVVPPHPLTMVHSPEPDQVRARPRRRIVFVLGGLFLLGLVLLALPLLGVRSAAEQTQTDLTRAMDALKAGDLPRARESVASARRNVDEASDDADGLGGDVWSVIPVAGTAVDDVRLLVDALDDATSVAEIGVDLYPSVAGKQATLFEDERLDLPTLARVTSAVREAGGHLIDADESLDEVSGSTPLIGGVIAAKRDQAAAEVSPMVDAYSGLEPMLDDLPSVFGAEGERSYLVAMLNPAELRYSGGATLAFAPMTWQGGTLELGESIDLSANPRLYNQIRWPKVRGNTFHDPGFLRMRNATIAPSWSVSGEELLRAWHRATGVDYDGVLAVDVVTLARLFSLTGPVDVPGYGELTGDNLVKTLIGSYDQYYPDPSVQDEFSAGLIPAFKDKLFEGGDYVAKGRVLAQAADGRHLATYFRDEDVQEGFTALGLEGDLAEPSGDYLGVFTQNTNGSKVDYWQRRSVTDRITLAADGTARHRLEVVVHNDTPPYAAPVPDPQFGYFTRWAGMFLSTFVPDGTQMRGASLDGRQWDGRLRRFREHDYLVQRLLVEPQGRAQLDATYRVPDAATSEDGELRYHLAVDSQGLVIPQQLDLTVRLPDGYTATSVPEGWTLDGSTLSFSTDALDASQEWEIIAEASN